MVRAISSSVARARYYAGLSLIFWQPEWLAERQVWHSGEIVPAFGGNGGVRVFVRGGALLLERAMPGESLVNLAVSGRDDEAATIMAAVIHRTAGRTPPPRCPTLHD